MNPIVVRSIDIELWENNSTAGFDGDHGVSSFQSIGSVSNKYCALARKERNSEHLVLVVCTRGHQHC